MKTRLLFGIIVILSSLWIGYALWMVKNQTTTLVAHNYFTDHAPIIFINRNDACAPIPDTQLGDRELKAVIKEDFFAHWKSIGLQIDTLHNERSFLLEEQARIKDEDVVLFLNTLGFEHVQPPNSTPQVVNNWTIIRSNGYLAIHDRMNVQAERDTHAFSQQIINRDIHASYSIIDINGISEVYCHAGHMKTFHATNNSSFKVTDPPVMDLEMYSVLPANTESFIFYQKGYIATIDSSWSDPSIASYIDNGIVLSSIQGNKVWLIDISGKFTPQEILGEFAADKTELQSQIVKLNRSFGSVSEPLAMGLENILIVSENKSILEHMRIAYQTGNLFINTSAFQSIKKHGAQRVHSRWYNPKIISISYLPEYAAGDLGHAIYTPNENGRLVAFTSMSKTSEKQQFNPLRSDDIGKIIWNFSLENKNSRFFTNKSSVCVVNPDKKTVSIVSAEGKVATWIQLTGNFKTVHPMEGGFLIEQFDQLIWLSDSAPYDKKEIPFKGAIASTIAPYVWKGVPSISLISENLLYRISLTSGKSETNKIPQSKQITAGQLHAFNLNGDLAFGVFTDSILHIYNSKTTKWQTAGLDGEVCWSKKIDGKVYYLTKSAEKYTYFAVLNNLPMATIPTNLTFVGATETNQSLTFSFKTGYDLAFFKLATNELIISTSEIQRVEYLEPLFTNNAAIGFIELDGVRNELIIRKDISSQEKMTLNASQFIKVIGTNNVITFIDGQLVMYSF